MSRCCRLCGTEYPDDVAFCGHDGAVTIEVTRPGEERDPRLGVQLGDYIIVAHVADGAMGSVYEARNAETRQRVAIKVLHSDVAEDEIAVERFKREYETADMFDHPHIVRVLDFGETSDGSRFMTMEYLSGMELGELLRGKHLPSPARVLRVLAQVAQALAYAHAHGVVHRDLKPDNVFLCKAPEGDHVRLLDFGSVKLQVETGPKLTAFGTTLGSPFYMSPEQAKGLPDVDARTDVFAMGAMLYEALSGKIAFEAPTVAEILMKIVRHKPAPLTSVRPMLPPGIDSVIDRALAKDKTKRMPTPTALVEAALAAFGVHGTSAEWAVRPLTDLELAIDSAVGTAATEPPPSDTSAPSVPIIASGHAPVEPVSSGSRVFLFAGLALAAFLLAGGAVAVVLYLIG